MRTASPVPALRVCRFAACMHKNCSPPDFRRKCVTLQSANGRPEWLGGSYAPAWCRCLWKRGQSRFLYSGPCLRKRSPRQRFRCPSSIRRLIGPAAMMATRKTGRKIRPSWAMSAASRNKDSTGRHFRMERTVRLSAPEASGGTRFAKDFFAGVR
jgi:hypothetical protein